MITEVTLLDLQTEKNQLTTTKNKNPNVMVYKQFKSNNEIESFFNEINNHINNSPLILA